MKLKNVVFFIGLLVIPTMSYGQILKKLKKKIENATERAILKRSEEKTEEVVENAFDSISKGKNPSQKSEKPNNGSSRKNGNNQNKKSKEFTIIPNEVAKRKLYTTDLIVTTSEDGAAGSSMYFDVDAIAMRAQVPDEEYPIYIDNEGYNYGYNKSNNRWEKTGLLRSDAAAFMMPMMTIGIAKLPAEPMLKATKQAKQKGISLNTFMIVEWAFVYAPEHFTNSGFIESKSKSGLRYDYTETDYKGSYVLFDKDGRLEVINMVVNTPEGIKHGVYNFDYADVKVDIPNAVEVKMPFQDLFMPGADALPPAVEDNQNIPRGTADAPSQNNLDKPKAEEGPSPNLPSNPSVTSKEYLERFPGITAVMKSNGESVTFYYDTKNQLMEVISANKKAPPMFFDGNEHIYIVQQGQCIQARFDLNLMFDQLVEGLQGENLPPDMDPVKIRNDYYTAKYGIDMTIKKFPIAEWPEYITPDYFQDKTLYEKSSITRDGSNYAIYTALTGEAQGSIIAFDSKNRLKEIQSNIGDGGSVVYGYAPKTVSLPQGNCKYLDMNQDVIARLFRK